MQDRTRNRGWLGARTLYLLCAIALYWYSFVNAEVFRYITVFALAPATVLLAAAPMARRQVRWNVYHVLLCAAAAIFIQAAVRNGNLSPRGLAALALGVAAVFVAPLAFGDHPRRGVYRACFILVMAALALVVLTSVCAFFDKGDWLPWIAGHAARRSASERVKLARAQTQTLKGLAVLTYACGALLVAGIVPAEAEPADLRRESEIIAAFVVTSTLLFIVPAVVSVFIGRPITFPPVPIEKIGIQEVGLYGDRIRSLQHANKVAQMAVIGMFSAFYCLINRAWPRLKGLFIAAIAVYFMAMAHTQSRGSNIALGLGLGALVFRAGYQRLAGRRWRVLASLAAGALTLVLTVALVNGLFTADVFIATRINAGARAEEAPAPNLLDALQQSAIDKKEDEVGDARDYMDSAVEVSDGVVVSRAVSTGVTEALSNGRGFIWRDAIDFLIHHPVDLVLGMGSGDVIDRMKAYNPDRFFSYHLHNGFLEALARGGVFMLVCLVWALCLLVKPSARVLVGRDPGDPGSCVFPALIGMLLATALVEAVLFTDASVYNLLFFLAAGRVMRINDSDILAVK